ncbi:hypothetical protein N0V95_003646 [Ascochyta clinopodiicola]|nr:hypothetical protein N0V95_003646 [Ascochyta clinopodiicola]
MTVKTIPNNLRVEARALALNIPENEALVDRLVREDEISRRNAAADVLEAHWIASYREHLIQALEDESAARGEAKDRARR